MKKIYIINGAATVGKDTFVEICKYYFFIKTKLPTYNVSSVDQVKLAAKILGWNEVKDEKGRKFLSDLKDLSSSNYDGPYNYMLSKLESVKEGIFFFHVREPNEIAKFKERNPNTKTICIKRSSVETFTNHADANAYDYEYDINIDNSGTIDDLVNKVKDFVEKEIDF